MASVLKVNTLTGVTTAGSIVVTGEGNSTTTSLQQGLSKFWVRWNGTGTAAENDAFNSSGLTDNGTGQTTFGFSSNMNNANFSLATTSSSVEANNSQTNFEEATTSTIKMGTRNGGGSLTDTSLNFGQICGDLA
tara:strand:- start:32 stop:433 length:402 start_codon:yes stop_codon:yes gene_type:complete